MTRKKGKQSNSPNAWGALESVVNNSIRAGQLPLMGLIIILGISLVRMPPEDITKFYTDTFNTLTSWYILGWSLFIFTTVGWFITARKSRRVYAKEINRISQEKKELQQRLNSQRLPSSNTNK